MASRGAALVTGGARRIGRVLVATAAQAGFDVAIHVRSMDDEAEAAAGEVRAHGRKATILTCDLRKESAPLVLSQVFARRLPADREGLIVNLLDQRVLHPAPEFFSYSLSKSALWDATRMLAQALAPRIRVNAIGPGPVLASIHQDAAAFDAEARSTLLGRPASPAQIGAALRYLIDATAVTGQMIAVDSGQHLS